MLVVLPPLPVSGMLGMLVDIEDGLCEDAEKAPGGDVEETTTEGVMVPEVCVTTRFVSLRISFKRGYQTYKMSLI
jgi:hypothetical protein